jgi:endonuclease YncB( thermonuclease family)
MKLLLAKLLTLTMFVNACAQTDPSLVIGEFSVTKITDADTFRFDKLDRPARLLSIDTEETFKTPDAKEKIDEIALNWEEFYKLQKGESKFPVKTDSPLGYEAWKWAEEFMKDVSKVRLEREADDRSVDIFDRYLVYVIAMKSDGTEVNYNIESVRNGYSPYFNKYGNSKRFHEQFVEAQEYARENKLGIWDPAKKKYPDYDERLVWWNKRANQLENFEKKFSGTNGYINLSSPTDFEKLANYLGKEVTVFGGIGKVMTDKFPYLLRIPITKGVDFDLVIKEKDKQLLSEIDIDTMKEFYIYAKGVVEMYDGRYQIVLQDKEQIWMD